MSDFIPSDPKNISARPLNKGMFRDVPPTLIPEGGMYTIQNGLVKRGGIQKRCGSTTYLAGNQVNSSDQPIVGLAPVWQTDGSQIGCLLTSRYLYTVSGYAAPTVKYYDWTVGGQTCSVTDTTVTGSSGDCDFENDDVFSQQTGSRGKGDYFVLDVDGSGDGPEIIEIANVVSDTEITLASAPSGTYGAGTDWAIYKRFHIESETLLDWIVVDNKLIITDNKRTPYAFDGTDLDEYDSGISYVCGCLCVQDQRVWMGNVYEDSTYYRNRIRWSSATDRTSFNSADYLDVDHPGSGAIRRLMPLGNLLVAYFEDGIHIGRQTNITDLPRSFQMIETGRIGLIGPRAICGFLNGHAFVGQDDIYFLTTSGIERIGSVVLEDTIKSCAYPDYIYAAFDPLNERLVFGFPQSSREIEKIWSYNYLTKAWSYDLISCTSLTNPLLDLNLTWADLTDTGSGGILSANTWTGLGNDFATWGDIQGDVSFMELFYSQNGYLLRYTEDATDDNGVAIPFVLETPDMDFGYPNIEKTIKRLSLRIDHRPSADLLFTVQGSEDSGNMWKELGNFTIDTEHVEGRLSFFLTGSALRLRLTSTSRASKYIIGDATLRVIGRGDEFDLD
jgi:hypothetical protein